MDSGLGVSSINAAVRSEHAHHGRGAIRGQIAAVRMVPSSPAGYDGSNALAAFRTIGCWVSSISSFEFLAAAP